MKTLQITASLSADKGHIRENNEDNVFFNGFFLNKEVRDGGACINEIHMGEFLLYAIFDGMGGIAYGEESSYIASHITSGLFSNAPKITSKNVDEFVNNLIKQANNAVCNRMYELNSGRMGATVALVAIYGNKAKIYNVGDSRVYFKRKSEFSQISLDDSVSQRLYRMGVISKSEALIHKDRNKLVQHLGISENEFIIEPHVSKEIKLKNNDMLLLCSDGLTDMVSDERINEILSSSASVGEKSEELMCEALSNGGKDNISVILLEANNKNSANKNKIYTLFILLLAVMIVSAIGVLILFSSSLFDDKSRSSSPKADMGFFESVSEDISKTIPSFKSK